MQFEDTYGKSSGLPDGERHSLLSRLALSNKYMKTHVEHRVKAEVERMFLEDQHKVRLALLKAEFPDSLIYFVPRFFI